ncbi:MAG TPA: hypothetical protein VKA48_00595 [Gammaproteobacteria bacterium]|nr:hypothetical protein [Gammaproteobacteria bacterium]
MLSPSPHFACMAYRDQGGWIAECAFPWVVAQGDSMPEVKRKLRAFLDDRMETVVELLHDGDAEGAEQVFDTRPPAPTLLRMMVDSWMARFGLFDREVHQIYLERDRTILPA